MKKLLLGALIALLPLTGFAATILGFQVGGGIWAHDPNGTISTSADGVGVSADLKDDLQLSKKSESYSYFLVEHPVPVIPNFKYVNTMLTTAGSGTVTATFTFAGNTYLTNAAVTTQLELSQIDKILYYEILDNAISLDIGINIKSITGKAVVNADTTTFSGDIPMLYVAAEISLPADLALAGEISTISAAGNTINDITLKVMYTTSFDLGVEAGIRTQNYNIDVDNVQADVKFSGIFAGVYYKF
jgi:outer membrane protein